MRILHFVSGLDSAAGGPSRSVPNQCLSTISPGFEVSLAFIDRGNELAPEVTRLPDRGIVLHPLSARNFATTLPKLIRGCDVLHINGIWLPSCLWAAHIGRFFGKPYVVTPHGMLEPWCLSYHKRRKQMALLLGFATLLRKADVIQATAISEAANIATAFGLNLPLAVIPNTVDVPTFDTSVVGQSSEKRIAFLSRIHPKKGVVELIRAVHKHEQTLRGNRWRVQIAGPDSDGHWREVEQCARSLGVMDLVEHLGPIDGDRKWQFYREATLFVLPTYSENFGLVVAEALACGVPCLTTHGAPWSELESSSCGWWHPVGQEHLDDALGLAICTPVEVLREMGNRAIALAREHYSVTAHRPDFQALYRWLGAGGPYPECCKWRDRVDIEHGVHA
ncbi:MAG TPA: glycosyltransferase [Polyangiaceae bacterium]